MPNIMSKIKKLKQKRCVSKDFQNCLRSFEIVKVLYCHEEIASPVM